nr:Crp/Fnr family transcriptional regulator [uncultured Sphingomonas sp.]
MDPFIRKLGHGARLGEADKALLRAMTGQIRRTPRGREIAEPNNGSALALILGGWACRYQMLASGKRQLVTLYIPGDLCQPFGTLPGFADYPVGSLTATTHTLVSHNALAEAAERSPACKQAFWWDLLTASNIERERIVSLGRRSAAERLGHLFCELQYRLTMAGVGGEGGCDMPLTQVDLADLLGLTPVHVNRSLQELRKAGLISLENRLLIIHEQAKLQELSQFNPSYLHLDHAGTARPDHLVGV